jgi:hypothetical protein
MTNPDSMEVRSRKKHPFFTVENDFLLWYGPRIGAYGIAVYCALSLFTNRDSECFPAIATIANLCRCGETKVREMLNLLIAEKLVSIEMRGHLCKPNLYTLLPVVKPDEVLSLGEERVRVANPSHSEPFRVRVADPKGSCGEPEQDPLNKTHSEQDSIPSTGSTYGDGAFELLSGSECVVSSAKAGRAVNVSKVAPARLASPKRGRAPADPRVVDFVTRYRQKVGAGYDGLWPEVVRLFACECNPDTEEAWAAFQDWYCSRSDMERQTYGVRVRTWMSGGRAADAILTRRRSREEPPEPGVSRRDLERDALIRQFEEDDKRAAAESSRGRFDRLEV